MFGATVTISNVATGEERRWRIVGENEADIAAGDISYMSPIGKAMIGKSEGDEVDVHTPNGKVTWSIDEVSYR